MQAKAANFLRSLRKSRSRVHVTFGRAYRLQRISDAMDLPVRVNNGLGYFAARNVVRARIHEATFCSRCCKEHPLMKLDKDMIVNRHPMDTLCDIVENTKDGHDTLIVAHRECIRLMNPEMQKTRCPIALLRCSRPRTENAFPLI